MQSSSNDTSSMPSDPSLDLGTERRVRRRLNSDTHPDGRGQVAAAQDNNVSMAPAEDASDSVTHNSQQDPNMDTHDDSSAANAGAGDSGVAVDEQRQAPGQYFDESFDGLREVHGHYLLAVPRMNCPLQESQSGELTSVEEHHRAAWDKAREVMEGAPIWSVELTSVEEHRAAWNKVKEVLDKVRAARFYVEHMHGETDQINYYTKKFNECRDFVVKELPDQSGKDCLKIASFRDERQEMEVVVREAQNLAAPHSIDLEPVLMQVKTERERTLDRQNLECMVRMHCLKLLSWEQLKSDILFAESLIRVNTQALQQGNLDRQGQEEARNIIEDAERSLARRRHRLQHAVEHLRTLAQLGCLGDVGG